MFVALFSSMTFIVYSEDGPIVELGGGFSSLASGSCCLPTTDGPPLGWYGTAAVRATDWLAVVGELGGDYETLQTQPPAGFGPLPTSHNALYGFFGGPRLGWRVTRHTTVFGDVLVGSVHRTWAVSFQGGQVVRGDLNQFAWQPGGAVDVAASDHVSFRVHGDYRLTPIEGSVYGHSQVRQPRFKAGIVLKY